MKWIAVMWRLQPTVSLVLASGFAGCLNGDGATNADQNGTTSDPVAALDAARDRRQQPGDSPTDATSLARDAASPWQQVVDAGGFHDAGLDPRTRMRLDAAPADASGAPTPDASVMTPQDASVMTPQEADAMVRLDAATPEPFTCDDGAESFRFGGTGLDRAESIAVDAGGFVHVTGTFTGRVAFGRQTLQSVGGLDVFIVKLSPQGRVVWARRAGGYRDDTAPSVAVSRDGSVYIAGFFVGEADFGGQTYGGLGSNGYLAKFSSDGAFAWAHVTSGSGCVGDAVSVAQDGSVYWAGGLYGACAFASGTRTPAGQSEYFLAKYSSDGRELWLRTGQGAGGREIRGMAVGPDGAAYLVGTYQGTLTIGSDTLQLSPSSGRGIFLARHDPDGSPSWLEPIGAVATGSSSLDAVAVDAHGSVYVAGKADGRVDFDGIVTPDGDRAVVAKYDAHGRALWARTTGMPERGTVLAVAVADDGMVFATGAALHSVPSAPGDFDTFVAVLTAGGEPLSVTAATATDGAYLTNWGRGIATGPGCTAYMTGSFSSHLHYAGQTLVSAGDEDVMVVRLRAPLGLSPAQMVPDAGPPAAVPSALATPCADQRVVWGFGASGLDRARAVDVGGAGSAYVTGEFSGTLRVGTHILDAKGETDVFLLRLDADGRVAWVRGAGSVGADSGADVTVVADGSVYVTGALAGPADFDGATYGAAVPSLFVAKYSPDGDLLWVKTAAGGGCEGRALTPHEQDNGVYVAGVFEGSCNIGPSGYTALNGADGFLLKYSEDGELIWGTVARGSGDDRGTAVATAPDGTVYFVGTFETRVHLGGMPFDAQGAREVFVARYDGQGNMLEAHTSHSTTLGSTLASADAVSARVGPQGALYVAGQASGVLRFDTFSLTTNGSAFVVKYDHMGEVAWLQELTPFYGASVGGLAVHADGTVFLTGERPIDPWTWSRNMYVARLAPNGAVATIVDADAPNAGPGTYGGGTGLDIAIGPNCDGYVVGELREDWDFGGAFLTHAGGGDAFILRFASAP